MMEIDFLIVRKKNHRLTKNLKYSKIALLKRFRVIIMSVSIKQVAKAAEVSVSAASKALNDYPDISEETRRKVKQVAKELCYIPNRSAQTLASKRMKDVAILWHGVIDDRDMDEVTISMMKGASRYALDNQMNVATYMIDAKLQDERALAEFCHEHSLSGILLFGLRTNSRYVQEAKSLEIPCVGVDYELTGPHTSSVRVNDRKAFEEITEYVLSCHHQRCVLVYGRRDTEVAIARHQGFLDALRKRGLTPEDNPIIYTDFQEIKAYHKTRDFIRKYGTENGTAFICMSDMLAMGVYQAINESGYRVYEDFSVTGFDGLGFLNYIYPKLTTINQKFYSKGYEAIKLLAQLVGGETNVEEVILPHNLIIGESVRNVHDRLAGLRRSRK